MSQVLLLFNALEAQNGVGLIQRSQSCPNLTLEAFTPELVGPDFTKLNHGWVICKREFGD